MTACRPAGGGWEAELYSEGTTIVCRLPDKPVDVGDNFVVTALDPPYFGTDGDAIEASPGAVGAGRLNFGAGAMSTDDAVEACPGAAPET